MIKCCECGIVLLIVGQIPLDGAFTHCPNCDTNQYAVPRLRKSFPEDWVKVDHEKKTVNIAPPARGGEGGE